MTREPSERIVSLYHYMRRNEAHVDHEEAKAIELEEFIEDDRWRMHTDNSFVRFIAGDLHAPRGSVDRALLQQAISNIEQHYFTTGSDRHFDESLVLLKRAYGWRDDIVYRRQNVNPNRPALAGLGDRVGRLLERWTELDRELVAFCDDRLRQTIDEQPDDFHREVAALKAAVASPGEPARPSLISRVVSRVR
jgi:hypothetical protein